MVLGTRLVPGATRTLLLYCHFDTKPAPGPGWLQPSPFEPVLRPGLAEDGVRIVEASEVADEALPAHRLYARGASDDKGPIWVHLEALALMDALGISPRVNLKLILEGEEEIGSPGFGAFVEAHRDLLAADLVLVTDGPKDASERPTVVFGARGILALTLELEVARRDVHSGNFSVPNPAWILTGLLASMAAPDGTPLIEGLGADAAPPTAAERELMDRIPLDRPALERELGVRLAPDYLERLMFRPTLTIRGLQAGFVGAEANTIIPHRATVALDLRLVKNQRVDAVYRRVVDPFGGRGSPSSSRRTRRCRTTSGAARSTSSSGTATIPRRHRPISRSRGASSRSSSAPTTANRQWSCPPRAAACRSGRSQTCSGSPRSSCPTRMPTTASTAPTSTSGWTTCIRACVRRPAFLWSWGSRERRPSRSSAPTPPRRLKLTSPAYLAHRVRRSRPLTGVGSAAFRDYHHRVELSSPRPGSRA